MKEKFKQVHPGEWVQPVRKGYLMQCCDCELVHSLDFRIVKLPHGKTKIQFRAFRIDKHGNRIHSNAEAALRPPESRFPSRTTVNTRPTQYRSVSASTPYAMIAHTNQITSNAAATCTRPNIHRQTTSAANQNHFIFRFLLFRRLCGFASAVPRDAI